jgi:penicillin-binding protein 1A
VAIRSRYGIRADVAGKTGTTQDNADGWFILMHPQLVGGAWVGFNDGRVTLRSDYWGQGAHSALPIVGDLAGVDATNCSTSNPQCARQLQVDC